MLSCKEEFSNIFPETKTGRRKGYIKKSDWGKHDSAKPLAFFDSKFLVSIKDMPYYVDYNDDWVLCLKDGTPIKSVSQIISEGETHGIK